MDILSSGLTAAFLGIIMALIRLVEWLLKRRSDDKAPVAQSYNGLSRLSDKMSEMNGHLIAIKGGIDGVERRLGEYNEDVRETAERMADVRAASERLGDRVGTLASEIAKLGGLPSQTERLAEAVQGLKDKQK